MNAEREDISSVAELRATRDFQKHVASKTWRGVIIRGSRGPRQRSRHGVSA